MWKNIFRSRFFIVILVLTLALVVIPTALSLAGMSMYVRNAVNTVLTPVQKLFTYATDALDGFVSYFTEFDRLAAENEQLRSEVNDLNDRIYSAVEIEKMNEWLYDYLELKREHEDFVFEPATVTGRESGNYMTVFTVDRGTSHGVGVGMPVVTNYGIVGHISECGVDWSKIETLIETDSSIGAYIERTGEIGVVEGDYSLSSQGLCNMTYLSGESDVAVGDRVLTSGFGSMYPRGLVVGYVESIEPDEYNRTKIAKIKPAETLTDLTKLMIITDYKAYAE